MSRLLHIAPPALGQVGFIGGRLVELAVLAAAFMILLALANRVLRLTGLLRRTRSAMLADLYEIRLYWRRAGLILLAQMRLALHLAVYLLLICPSIAIGAAVYLATKDLLANRYAFAPADPQKEIVICLSYPGLDKQGLALVTNLPDARIDASVVVPAAGRQFVRLQPVRGGSIRVQLPDQGESFSVNFGDTHMPARPIQQAGAAEVSVDYPPYRLWGMSAGYLLYMLVVGVCFGPLASAIVAGTIRIGAAQ